MLATLVWTVLRCLATLSRLSSKFVIGQPKVKLGKMVWLINRSRFGQRIAATSISHLDCACMDLVYSLNKVCTVCLFVGMRCLSACVKLSIITPTPLLEATIGRKAPVIIQRTNGRLSLESLGQSSTVATSGEKSHGGCLRRHWKRTPPQTTAAT